MGASGLRVEGGEDTVLNVTWMQYLKAAQRQYSTLSLLFLLLPFSFPCLLLPRHLPDPLYDRLQQGDPESAACSDLNPASSLCHRGRTTPRPGSEGWPGLMFPEIRYFVPRRAGDRWSAPEIPTFNLGILGKSHPGRVLLRGKLGEGGFRGFTFTNLAGRSIKTQRVIYRARVIHSVYGG